MRVPILTTETRWECPSCGLTDVTYEARPHSQMHNCSALQGLTTPMSRLKPGQVSLGRNEVQHKLIDREDYVGKEEGMKKVDGRVVSAVWLERKDGSNDTAVFAPVATGGSGEKA